MEIPTFVPKKITLTKKSGPTQSKIDEKIEYPERINLLDEVTPAITPIVESVVVKAIDSVAPGMGEVVSAVAPIILKGFRIENLPQHDEDFARNWFYSQAQSVNADNIVIEYNAYLQTLEEIKNGTLKLPDGFDGPTISFDINTYILRDFRNANQSYSPDDNLIHRAWFAHCAKRAIDGLRQGTFVGEEGYVKKFPEVADIIERRVDEIIMQNTLFKVT